MPQIQLNKTLTMQAYYDVIVAGGGVAGVAAAVEAKRHGKSVLIIEKTQKFGGLATTGIVNLFLPLCNGRGVKIIKGMAEELLKLCVKYGYDELPAEWQSGEFKGETAGDPPRYRTHFSAEIFALTLTELLCGEKVDILFDTVVTDSVMQNNHCKGLVVENKSGTAYYGAGVVIDATGDADVLFRSGVPTIQGKNYFTYYGQQINLETCRAAVESKNIQKAVKYIYGGVSNLYGKGHPEGMPLFTGTTAESVNNYLIKNQLFMLNKIKADDRFSRDIVTLPGMAQFRTTRCILGDGMLKEKDYYRHFEDSIAAVSDFDRRDYLYEIPYSTMVNSNFNNLITAGRTVCAEGYAWDVTRVIPPAILTGQAAGAAAAMALSENCAIGKINVKHLQQQLQNECVMIHYNDCWVPANFSVAE